MLPSTPDLRRPLSRRMSAPACPASQSSLITLTLALTVCQPVLLVRCRRHGESMSCSLIVPRWRTRTKSKALWPPHVWLPNHLARSSPLICPPACSTNNNKSHDTRSCTRPRPLRLDATCPQDAAHLSPRRDQCRHSVRPLPCLCCAAPCLAPSPCTRPS
jgi:hypothetical protein